MNKVIGTILGIGAIGGIGWLALSNETPVDSKTEPASIYRTDDAETTREFIDTGSEDYDCADFSSQDEAQEVFEDAGGPDDDPYNLDRDGDGIACETL